jgi:hypothetical protein
MRIGITLTLVSILFLFTGCSVGIKADSSDYPHIQFKAQIGYQEAYRRAEAFARHCHTSTNPLKASFNVGGNLFTDIHSGIFRINLANVGRDLEIIKIRSINDNISETTITVWGVGIWDEKEMLAAKQSILTGTLTCK